MQHLSLSYGVTTYLTLLELLREQRRFWANLIVTTSLSSFIMADDISPVVYLRLIAVDVLELRQ